MNMLTKQERIERLLVHEDATWHWRYWGLFFNLIVVAFISYQTSIYLPLIVFALYLPQLCVEWRKTKLLLTFNPDPRYRRWIYSDFIVEWFIFLLSLCLFAYYHTGFITIWTLGPILVIGVIGRVLFSHIINRAILDFDIEHVTSESFHKAKVRRNKVGKMSH